MRISGTAVIAVLLVSCSSAESTRRTNGDSSEYDDLWPSVARECLDLLESYERTDLEEASEDELLRQMQESAANQDTCAEAFTRTYRGSGGTVMANHLARSMTQHSLQTELALSVHYDEMAGYCDILVELIEALRDDTEELDSFMREGAPSDEDMRHLGPLLELTVQSLQISMLDYAETCSP